MRRLFKHTWSEDPQNPQEHPAPNDNIDSGESYGPHSADSMTLNFFVGGPIGDDGFFELNAHIHLKTGQDDRHVDTGTDTFNEDDNP